MEKTNKLSDSQKIIRATLIEGNSDKFASTSWTPEDVLEEAQFMGIDMTQEQAKEFLEKYDSKIVDSMVEAGWHTIQWFLKEDWREITHG